MGKHERYVLVEPSRDAGGYVGKHRTPASYGFDQEDQISENVAARQLQHQKVAIANMLAWAIYEPGKKFNLEYEV